MVIHLILDGGGIKQFVFAAVNNSIVDASSSCLSPSVFFAGLNALWLKIPLQNIMLWSTQLTPRAHAEQQLFLIPGN